MSRFVLAVFVAVVAVAFSVIAFDWFSHDLNAAAEPQPIAFSQVIPPGQTVVLGQIPAQRTFILKDVIGGSPLVMFADGVRVASFPLGITTGLPPSFHLTSGIPIEGGAEVSIRNGDVRSDNHITIAGFLQ